ncbi:hypothetical protein RFI_38435 [Reticulomyxa filosa]|uniref:Uncharacterized protein n=1 Tax=Reticulomyxa filosa TaxID=46433 RepID=X6LAK0_RETFI|nr:hypothetical protein RFI_38435 [Reticulomyxa filosa]|eukprot:ETN99052.1 hypothetical protein RFI_38435 [Reticulomyxa filosa]
MDNGCLRKSKLTMQYPDSIKKGQDTNHDTKAKTNANEKKNTPTLIHSSRTFLDFFGQVRGWNIETCRQSRNVVRVKASIRKRTKDGSKFVMLKNNQNACIDRSRRNWLYAYACAQLWILCHVCVRVLMGLIASLQTTLNIDYCLSTPTNGDFAHPQIYTNFTQCAPPLSIDLCDNVKRCINDDNDDCDDDSVYVLLFINQLLRDIGLVLANVASSFITKRNNVVQINNWIGNSKVAPPFGKTWQWNRFNLLDGYVSNVSVSNRLYYTLPSRSLTKTSSLWIQTNYSNSKSGRV